MPNKVDLTTCVTDINDIHQIVCNVGSLWRRLFFARIKSAGISGTEARALLCISLNPGLTQIQAATLLDLEPQNLMRSLDKLEENGWIRKQADANDRRIKCLHVTPEAKSILAHLRAVIDEIKLQVLSGIDAKDVELVVRELGKMRENLIQQLRSAEKE